MSGERTLTPSYRTFRKSKWRVGQHVGSQNYDEFFFSLGNLFNTCEQQLNSTPSDRSEFLFRRLDEYERKLSTLILRFCFRQDIETKADEFGMRVEGREQDNKD